MQHEDDAPRTTHAPVTAGIAEKAMAAPQILAVDVTPTNPSIAAGTKQQFVATATFSDMTKMDVSSSAMWWRGRRYDGRLSAIVSWAL